MNAARKWLSRVIAAARRVDRAVGRVVGPRVVLAEVRTPMNLAVLRPVLEPLLKDDRLSVWFTGPAREDVRAAFAELGVADRVVSRNAVRWMRVDLYLNADPWEASPLRRAAAQLNFFHGVAGKFNLDCPAHLPLDFRRYTRVAFPNQDRLQQYVDARIVTREHAALVGYPKLDALVNEAVDPRATAAALGLDPSRPTVIYAPTFSRVGSLRLAGEAIVEALLESRCNVIAKLHDRSLDPDPKYTRDANWRERLSRFAEPGRFLLPESGDSTRYVQASEVMITDHSSIGFEFCAMDRPVVVYDVPGMVQSARINPDKVALLRSASAVVRDTHELRLAVSQALRAPGVRSAARARAVAHVFYRPGGATQRAVALVYELLELAPAALAMASAAVHVWSE